MNAREYFRKWNGNCEDEHEDFAINFAESYHQAKLKDELPTEEEIRRIIYDDAYPVEWKDKTPFEKTRFGEDTAKAIYNLLKGER